MKNILLLCIFLSLQSCYSYIHVSDKNFGTDKEYKITDAKGISSKVTIINVKQDSVLIQKDGVRSTIARNEITKVQERKFSWLQTGGLVLGAVGGPLVLLAALMSNSIK